ncbi:MAG: TonB-dependent receptor [Rhodobacteraceae bacterium]|nr:TonB-dependent receptor [Paracoccaceae bacterium]
MEKPTRGRLRAGNAMAAFLSVTAMSSAPGVAAKDNVVQFDIAAQPLAQALIDFALQGDVSISLGGTSIGGLRTGGYHQTATPEDALLTLLTGTEFSFRKIDAASFVIVRQPREAEVPAEIPAPARPVEEIVVTAAKRSEVLQHAAYSVAVAEGAQLEATGTASLRDATPLLAGFSSTNQGPGRNKFFVRGLSDGAFSGQTQTAVGLYLDDTRITFNAPDPNLELIDIDRIEVVRGPQGTLYGAGAIGGLVRIITNSPQFDEIQIRGSVGAATTYSGDPSFLAQGTVNIPLAGGKAAVRGSVYFHRYGGFIDDTGLGRDNVNGTDISGGRIVLAGRLGDTWTVEAGAVLQGIDSSDTQYFDRAMPRYVRANRVSEPHDNDFRRFHVRVDGAFEWMRVVSSTAWMRHGIDNRYDASVALPLIANLPVQSAAYDDDSRHTTIIHETRLVSNTAGRFEWLAGVFASHRDQVTDSALSLANAGTANAPLYTEHRVDDGDELAAFGEFSYRFTQATTATVGLRWFRGVLDSNSIAGGVAAQGPPEAIGHNSHNGVTPKIVLSTEVGPDALIYAEAAKGFRLGGINIDGPLVFSADDGGGEEGGEDGTERTVTNFKSDTLWNFEIGAKSAWFDRRLTVNAAAFYAVWKNIQSDQLRNSGLPYTSNIGTAHNRGLEIDLAAYPTDRLSFAGNLTWNMPELTTLPASTAPTHSDRLPVVPRLSAGASAQYRFSLPGDIEGNFSVGYSYIGKSRLNFGADAGPDMGGYHIANTRLNVTRGPWSATIYVDNIGNARSNTFAFGNPFSLQQVSQVTPPTPRTLGVTLGWTY